jgi:hypothetical protein
MKPYTKQDRVSTLKRSPKPSKPKPPTSATPDDWRIHVAQLVRQQAGIAEQLANLANHKRQFRDTAEQARALAFSLRSHLPRVEVRA